MDAQQFDIMTRVYGAGVNRRRMVAALLGGGVSLLGVAERAGAKSSNCKPKCDECSTCNRGPCHKNNNGKKKCKRGTCEPAKADGTACGHPNLSFGVCLSGTCVLHECQPILPNCATDSNGQCVCQARADNGLFVCTTNKAGAPVANCASCGAGTVCVGSAPNLTCVQRCGVA